MENMAGGTINAAAIAAIISAFFTGLIGLIAAIASWWKSGKDYSTLKKTTEAQGAEITALREENRALKQQLTAVLGENEKLRGDNEFLQAVLTEYREKLLPALQERRTQPRKGAN